jgi:HK97 family phage portal protein
MLRKILDRLTGKSGLAKPDPWLKDVFEVEETYAGVDITPHGSLASSTVTACVRLLSESVASLPLHVYRRTDNGKVRATDHPLYGLLHDKPNDYQTSYVWRAHMLASVLLHGNAYSAIERDMQGRIGALWPLESTRVTVKAEGGELFYEAFIRGERRRYAFGDVLHIKGPSLDGVTGLSIIKLARQGIGLDLAQTQFGASLYKNKARPGLILKSPQALGPEAKDKLRESFSEKFSGALNAGKVVVLEGGLEIDKVGFSADDAQFLQSRQFSVQDICRWFKVNAHLVGDPSRLAYASSEAEFNAYLVHSLGPWLVNIQSEMNCTLLPDRTTFLIEFDPNGMARGSQVERYAAYEKGLASGFLTVADVRAAENLPFLPGTDQLQAAMAPKEVSNVAA